MMGWMTRHELAYVMIAFVPPAVMLAIALYLDWRDARAHVARKRGE